MTLLHTILAGRSLALRAAALECWPEGTVLEPADVLLHGVSLAEAARTASTPAVRIGRAAQAWPLPAGTPQRFVTVVLTRVDEVVFSSAARRSEVWVDADLSPCRPIPAAVRVIGRRPVSRTKRMNLRSPAGGFWEVHLPVDTTASDLVAVPCEGVLALSEVRQGRRPYRAGSGSGQEPEEPDDGFLRPWCLK